MQTTIRKAVAALLLAGASQFAPLTAEAHHSYVMFDREKVVPITGTVRKIARVSPHGTIWLTVANHNGAYDVWAV